MNFLFMEDSSWSVCFRLFLDLIRLYLQKDLLELLYLCIAKIIFSYTDRVFPFDKGQRMVCIFSIVKTKISDIMFNVVLYQAKQQHIGIMTNVFL